MRQGIVILLAFVLLIGGAAHGSTVDTVLTRYINALGGDDRLSEAMTLSLEMEVAYDPGPNVRSRMYFDVGKGFVQTLVTDTSEIGVAGKVGSTCWRKIQDGYELVPQDQQTTVSLPQFICPAYEYGSQGVKLTYGGVVKQDSLVAHEIIAVREITRDTSHLYFDTTSNLLARTRKGDLEIRFSGYADIGGILLYHKYEVISDGWTSTTNILSAKLNKPIPDAVFAVPPAVQSLVKKNDQGTPDVVIKSVSLDDLVAVYNHTLARLNERLKRAAILSRESTDGSSDGEIARLEEISKNVGRLLQSLSQAKNEEIARCQDSIKTSLVDLRSGLEELEQSLE